MRRRPIRGGKTTGNTNRSGRSHSRWGRVKRDGGHIVVGPQVEELPVRMCQSAGLGDPSFNEFPASTGKRAWARLIEQVYEADPLMCPRCSGTMRIIAFIEQPEVIEKILTHLGLWPAPAHSPPLESMTA